MSNPFKTYKANKRANPASGLTWDATIARWFYETAGTRHFTYRHAKRNRDYLAKFTGLFNPTDLFINQTEGALMDASSDVYPSPFAPSGLSGVEALMDASTRTYP